MTQSRLLKKIEGLELWTSVTEGVEHFAVKVDRKRARVLATLAEAETYLATSLNRIRAARSH